MSVFVLRADGGSRGNPGPAAGAFILENSEGAVVAQGGRHIGVATNNVAEYEGLLDGLDAARELQVERLEILLDSELIVKQLGGQYRVKDEKLKPLYQRAKELMGGMREVSVAHIPRAQNAAADALVNVALDTEAQTGSLPAESQATLFAGDDDMTQSTAGTYELTVKAHFDAAHELSGYPGECRELHGHTWDVEVTVAGTVLDAIGIVYDFKRLKDDLAAVLAPYDHAHLNAIPPFDAMNPTAENLAREIWMALSGRVGEEVSVLEVAVWESPIAKIVYRP